LLGLNKRKDIKKLKIPKNIKENLHCCWFCLINFIYFLIF
jgi:hypothetical protein